MKELKQEIEEYLTRDYCCEFKKECKDGIRVRCSEYEAKLYLILRFAEPREKQIAELERELDYQKQARSIAENAVVDLQQENARLKCECRRCVYTDRLCILSDYGKDRNGICDHFKDVFDEVAELKEELKAIDEAGEHVRKQITESFRNKKPYWELEKENAELKRNEFNARSCLELQQSQDKAILNYMGDQLTKSKAYLKYFIEILKKLRADKEPLVIEAEQFLKNDECPDVMCEDCTKEDCGIKKLGLVGKVK